MNGRTLSRAIAALLVLGTIVSACDSAEQEHDGAGPLAPGGDDALPDPPACDGPLGAPRDPSTLVACCDAAPDMHCVDGPVGDKLERLFGGIGGCGDGTCVADDFIATGGVFTPQRCTSISGAEGACLSVCAPKVAEKAALLPQDVCEDSERCVPCISPLDNLPTGACNLAYTCEEGYLDAPDDDPPGPTCPHQGPPIIDPQTLEPCQGCGLGHCLGNDKIPADKLDMFAACDAYQRCVPDAFIAAAGNYVPPTCASIAGVEGRCLSTCLPDVAAKAGSLPQDVCAAEHLCVPCYDPIDGSDTGACRLSCDPGPAGEPETLPACCGDIGSCVPAEIVPSDQLSSLPTGACEGEPDSVCVPHAFLEEPMNLVPCETVLLGNLFGEEYKPGVCLPDCLPAVDNVMLNQDGCPAHFKCAPCIMPPYGESTGACDLQ